MVTETRITLSNKVESTEKNFRADEFANSTVGREGRGNVQDGRGYKEKNWKDSWL